MSQAAETGWEALTGVCCAAGSVWCAGTGEQPEPGSSIQPVFPCTETIPSICTSHPPLCTDPPGVLNSFLLCLGRFQLSLHSASYLSELRRC